MSISFKIYPKSITAAEDVDGTNVFDAIIAELESFKWEKVILERNKAVKHDHMLQNSTIDRCIRTIEKYRDEMH